MKWSEAIKTAFWFSFVELQLWYHTPTRRHLFCCSPLISPCWLLHTSSTQIHIIPTVCTRYHIHVRKIKKAPGTRYCQACFQTFVLDREHSPPHKDIPGTAHHTYHTRYVDKKKNVDWVGYYTSTSCTFHMYVPVSTTGHVCIYATHIGKTAASQQLVNIKNPHNN